MVPKNLNSRAKKLFVREAINLALLYPYLAPVLIRKIFPQFAYEQEKLDRIEFATQLWKTGIDRLYPDAVAHALYIVLKENAPLNDVCDDDVLKTLELNDCISNILLLEYAKQNNRTKVQRKVKAVANKLKSVPKREQDQHWLLVYQVWNKDELEGAGQKFLAELKKDNFRFLRLEGEIR